MGCNKNISTFFDDNQISLFGEWSSESLKKLGRNISFLLTKNKNDYKKYEEIAKKTYGIVSWGNDSGLKSPNFMKAKLNISDSDMPCIVIMSPSMLNFHVCKNIHQQKLLHKCEKLIMKNDIPFNKVKYDAKYMLQKNDISYLVKIFLISFVSVLFVALIIVFVICFFILRCDQPKKQE